MRSQTAALIEIAAAGTKHESVLENLSPSGGCIFLYNPIAVGTEMSISVSGVKRTAIARHCEPCEDGFRVGVEFTPLPWPEPIATPFHWIGTR